MNEPFATHWIAVPILLPLAAGIAALLLEERPRVQALISVVSTLALALVAIALVAIASSGDVVVYLLGNWKAPFGIALALDRLSAMMVALTALIGIVSVIFAQGSKLAAHGSMGGRHFSALVQFQLAGVNGAFLTADLFNLFVFFELLLIASYGLLLHGGGEVRVRAAVHYVIFNLAGSALFLVALAILYGVTGTLNMADLAVRIAAAVPEQAPLVRAAALRLFVVFGVKAALFPLYFWLPESYRAAAAPVAALFAIMTKVGVYGILRTSTLLFGAQAGPVGGVGLDELSWLAIATLVLATCGALAALRLRVLAAYLAIGSTGTLLLAIALAAPDAIASALFYLGPSTLVGAALFLLIDGLASNRGDATDRLIAAPMAARTAFGALFFAFALDAAGLPPFGGFLGKLMLLKASAGGTSAIAVWSALLVSSFGVMIALARAGSTVFWKSEPTAIQPQRSTPPPAQRGALALLLVSGLMVAAGAGPVERYTRAAATQLTDPAAYVAAVFHAKPRPSGAADASTGTR